MDGEKNNLAPEEKEKEEVKPAEQASEEKEGFDFGRLLFGLLAISFGLFLLGKSTGYISEDLYIDIFQFWPTLIVVAGLSLLDTRRPFSFVLALLAFAAVAAFVGTAVKDAVLEDGSGDGRIIPIRMDGDWEWEMRGPVSGPVEGI
jgi:hypothetical protein